MRSVMEARMGKWGLCAGLLVGLLAGGSGMAWAQTVSAVAALDLERYTGTWYEVARYPNKAEKRCVSDGMMLYALGDKPYRFQRVSSCEMKDGVRDVRNANGKAQDKSGDGRFKVSSMWPFSSKQWVLAVGPAYEWALVGAPNHKTLWVLSRTATMTPEVLAEIEGKAAAEGFDKSKLVMVAQGK
jgi:apolipoprotein D and lipocalin family protein